MLYSSCERIYHRSQSYVMLTTILTELRLRLYTRRMKKISYRNRWIQFRVYNNCRLDCLKPRWNRNHCSSWRIDLRSIFISVHGNKQNLTKELGPKFLDNTTLESDQGIQFEPLISDFILLQDLDRSNLSTLYFTL
jgi:hypothetical protein